MDNDTFARELANAVNRKDSEYGVKGSFLHNEDTVQFYDDDKKWDEYR